MQQTVASRLLLVACLVAATEAAGLLQYYAWAPGASAGSAWLQYWTRMRLLGASLESRPPQSGSAFSGPCDPALNNTSWFDGCNTCLCQNGALGVCTLRYCYDNYYTSVGCPAGMKAGDTWFVHCNKFTCTSPLTGVLTTVRTLKGHCWDTSRQAARLQVAQSYARQAAASAAAALTTNSSGPCSKSEFWFDGCNRCRCYKGEPVVCTKMACAFNDLVNAGCPAGRVAGDTWYADCNRHRCQTLGGGPLITVSTANGQCW